MYGRQKIFGPYNLRVLSGGVNIDIDIQEQKKDELIYDMLKSEYTDEVKKSDRIDEEARGLVPEHINSSDGCRNHFPVCGRYVGPSVAFPDPLRSRYKFYDYFDFGVGLSDTGKYFSNNQAVDL